MEEKREKAGDEKKSVVNHYEAGSNCQVFNGNITGCVFAMPGSTVTQQAAEEAAVVPADRYNVTADNRYNVITLLRDNEARGNSGGNETHGGQGGETHGGQGGETVERFHFIHPSLGDEQEWLVHDEVARLVRRQGIQEICAYLKQLADTKKILLPQSPSAAYAELVRMGMPNGDGFSDKTFQKHYRR